MQGCLGVTPSAAGSTPQGSPDQPAPLRHGIWKTWNQLPWRYQNFGLQADTSPSNIWNAWAGLHVKSGLYNAFWGSTVWMHSIYTTTCLWSSTHFGIDGNFFKVTSVVDFWIVGKWTKDYLSQVQLPHQRKKFWKSICIETLGVQQPHPESQVTDKAKNKTTMQGLVHCVRSGINTTRFIYWGVTFNNWLFHRWFSPN